MASQQTGGLTTSGLTTTGPGTPPAAVPGRGAPDLTPVGHGRPGADEPAATRGKTAIADLVVVKIAGIAAREIPGVHDMGGGLSRTIGAVRDRVPVGRPSVGRGVKVEVGEVQTAIDLELVVEYGVSIADVARDVRENVVSAVERTTGLEVVEVNVTVNDVHLPEDDQDDGRTAETRVS
ncbi:Asp23/Gls24 family envelope stress response protein [Streptomyces sp. NPDC087440]|uniref:Asp23/Gls24 family envelope stress response protein n=1 Tax=Streptomyces sp. NPDC087440 TaxID=3365790 RepID=UPI00381B770E